MEGVLASTTESSHLRPGTRDPGTQHQTRAPEPRKPSNSVTATATCNPATAATRVTIATEMPKPKPPVKPRPQSSLKPPPPPKKMDAQAILATLEQIRSQLPKTEKPRPPRRKNDEGRIDARSIEDFEMAAVIAGLESLADDVHAIVEEKQAKVLDEVLKIYYVSEELAREPGNEELVKYCEDMRTAYQKDYGRPIPSRAESEARGLVIPPHTPSSPPSRPPTPTPATPECRPPTGRYPTRSTRSRTASRIPAASPPEALSRCSSVGRAADS